MGLLALGFSMDRPKRQAKAWLARADCWYKSIQSSPNVIFRAFFLGDWYRENCGMVAKMYSRGMVAERFDTRLISMWTLLWRSSGLVKDGGLAPTTLWAYALRNSVMPDFSPPLKAYAGTKSESWITVAPTE